MTARWIPAHSWQRSPPSRRPVPKTPSRRFVGSTDTIAYETLSKLLTGLAEWTGSDLLTYWGTRLVSSIRPYNMIVTNVPGPQQPLYLLGARLEATYPQLPLFEHQGLGVAVMSYLGKLQFGLVADWDVVPDLTRFARSIDASVAALEESIEKR